MPGSAQVFAAGKHLGFGVFEARVDLCALDGIAGRAAGYEIAGILLPFTGARNDEVHAHDQCVFETGAAIQAAILTDVIVALENLAAFFDSYRRIYERKRNAL